MQPTSLYGSIVLAFVGGAVREALCVAWVRSVAREDAILAAVTISALDAVALRMGLGESLAGVAPGAAWVAGCALGTLIIMAISRWTR
jgi:hypothetical protein